MTSTPARQCVLITVSGPDQPGITAALAEIIAAAGAEILDMEQVVIQGLLSLSMVLDHGEDGARGRPVLKDLLFRAKEFGLDMNFRVLPAEEVLRPREHHRQVLTLIGHAELTAGAIARVAQVLARHGCNIEKIQRLDEGRARCLELLVDLRDPAQLDALKSALLPVGNEFALDLALQPDNLFRRVKRLVVMDLDSTLVQAEAIDELARLAHCEEAVRAITARAMNGEMDFAEALRRRVALLRGLGLTQLETVAERLPLTEGAETLIRILKRLGYRTAIISGGFEFFCERVRRRLGIDTAHANRLEIEDGRLTGRVLDPIIDGARKAVLMEEIARREGLRLDQVIAVGDGANDLPMLRAAGLGIAFNAKPVVRAAARHSLNQSRLDSILFLLGISQKDVEELERDR
jgi:phosphoserine phosphatase